MIPLSEINDAATKYGVASETIEKDYVISWILDCISQSDLFQDFVFYGGTAIKRVFFDEHRFSEDIDLISTKKFNEDQLKNKMEILKLAKDEAGITIEINADRTIIKKDRVLLYLNYDCHEEIIGAPKEIQIDFNMNADIYGEQEHKKIIGSYSDITPKHTLRVMSLNTILACKLGMLTEQRTEPRDVFDIWFLLRNRERFDFEFKKICRIFKSIYAFDLTSSKIENCLKSKGYVKTWEIRLKQQLSDLPSYRHITKEIVDTLDVLFSN